MLTQRSRSRQTGLVSPRVAESQKSPRPFVLEYRSEHVRRDGGFTPNARVSLTTGLGASGLMITVAPEELATLLLVLSQVTPSGSFVATPETLAPMLGISRNAMRRQLERLAALDWRGQPLVEALSSESGLLFFVPSRHLFDAQSNAIVPIPQGGRARDAVPYDAPSLPPPRHEEKVALSRQRYARPRGEVESEIGRFLGSKYGPPPAPREATAGKPLGGTARQSQEGSEARRWLSLKKRLAEIGFSTAQASRLLEGYPLERVERQVEWLPLRGARSPVAYLLAAVAGDYAPPKTLLEAESPPSPEPQTSKEPIYSRSMIAAAKKSLWRREGRRRYRTPFSTW